MDYGIVGAGMFPRAKHGCVSAKWGSERKFESFEAILSAYGMMKGSLKDRALSYVTLLSVVQGNRSG